MCFHGRNKSLEACDSGAGTGVGSTAGETEPVVMEILQIVTENGFLPLFIRAVSDKTKGS
jgi:hypothetical protein